MKKQNKYNVLIILKNLVAVEGFEPPTSQMINDLRHQCQLALGIFLCPYIIHALFQLSYTTYHVYCKHHRSRLNCFALTGILFSPALPFVFFVSYVAETATIRPSILTTSLGLALLPICLSTTYPVGLADSEITSFLPVVLTGWIPSLSTPSALRSLSLPFQLMALHDPLRDYSPPLLPLCIQYIQPTCRDCSPHVPRRLWKVRDSNPRAFQLTTSRRSCLSPLSQPSCCSCG